MVASIDPCTIRAPRDTNSRAVGKRNLVKGRGRLWVRDVRRVEADRGNAGTFELELIAIGLKLQFPVAEREESTSQLIPVREPYRFLLSRFITHLEEQSVERVRIRRQREHKPQQAVERDIQVAEGERLDVSAVSVAAPMAVR